MIHYYVDFWCNSNFEFFVKVHIASTELICDIFVVIKLHFHKTVLELVDLLFNVCNETDQI